MNRKHDRADSFPFDYQLYRIWLENVMIVVAVFLFIFNYTEFGLVHDRGDSFLFYFQLYRIWLENVMIVVTVFLLIINCTEFGLVHDEERIVSAIIYCEWKPNLNIFQIEMETKICSSECTRR